MTAIRRIAPSNGPRRTRRPDRIPSHVQARAAAAVVVPLFPRAGRNLSETDNIFADLALPEPAPAGPTGAGADPRLEAARARARALMPQAGLPRIDNLFRDDGPDVEPDVQDEIFALALSRLKAHPRPLAAARNQLCALHEDRSRKELRAALTRHLPAAAAAFVGLVAYAHFGALPAI